MTVVGKVELNMTKSTINRRMFMEGLALGAAVVASPSLALGAADSYIVSLPQGKLRGTREGTARTYKGIPYGGETSGIGRFRAPRPPVSWAGIRDASEYGPPCLQKNDYQKWWQDPKPGSENCLFLNVWTPERVTGLTKKPVMVWFHGGAFANESGGTAPYNGAELAARGDVIVVTVNHRLNIFGYLWLGDLLPDYAEDGNPGQRDLVASLKWVRANIAHFGGDPENITIFGESGGGAKVSSVLATPSARGLFHKAIVQSGSQLKVLTRAQATDLTLRVLDYLKIDRKDAHQLIAADADQLTNASLHVQQGSLLAWQPVVDGKFMPHQTWTPGAPAECALIPMIIGTTSEESAQFVRDMRVPIKDDADIKARLLMMPLDDQQFATLLANYRRLLPNASRQELAVAIGTDTWMWKSAVAQAERQCAQARAPVYCYEFAWKTPCFGGMWALHAVDIPFVFGHPTYATAWDGEDSDAQRAAADPQGDRFRLIDQTVAAWAAFAHTGNPSTDRLAWPPYELTERKTMIFDHTSNVVNDPRKERRILVANLPPAW
jgi:para-nitrobenzyl esterase